MKAGTLLRLATAGSRTDTIRVALTAVSATLASMALLAAATVGAVPELGTSSDGSDGWNQQYASPLLQEPGLRPGVIAALLLLALPVLALAAQCIRLGAPARDRRLAALRLAGATPRQTVLVASAETAVGSFVGAVLGLGGYLALRRLLHRPDADGRLPLPTDVLPNVGVIVVVLVAIPLLAGLIGAVLLRTVIVTPLGVVRRVRERAPRPWPGVLIIAGVGLFGAGTHLSDRFHLDRSLFTLLLSGCVAIALIGVVLGTAWLSHTTGRLLLRFGARPAMLLAGRRLLADPWNGSRTFAALLAGVMAGAIALGYRALLATEFRVYDRFNELMGEANGAGAGPPNDQSFYFNAIDLVMVAVAVAMTVAAAGVLIALIESVVARRRSYVALTAVGVPRRTLSEAVLWHTIAPLVPAVLTALAVGVSVPRLINAEVSRGGSYEYCTGTAEQCLTGDPAYLVKGSEPLVVMAVPIPFGHLALLGAAALLAMLVVVGIGMLVQRRTLDLEELRAT